MHGVTHGPVVGSRPRRTPLALTDGAFRWSKKFSDTFCRFDTIPECDSQPPCQPASHVAVAITLNALAKASSLKMNLFIQGAQEHEVVNNTETRFHFTNVSNNVRLAGSVVPTTQISMCVHFILYLLLISYLDLECLK